MTELPGKVPGKFSMRASNFFENPIDNSPIRDIIVISN